MSGVTSSIGPKVASRGVVSDGESVNIGMVDGFSCFDSVHPIWRIELITNGPSTDCGVVDAEGGVAY